MRAKVEQLETEALAALATVRDAEEIKALDVRYLGRKGQLTLLLRGVAALPTEERPAAGQRANQARQRLTAAFGEALQRAETERLAATSGIDVSLPGRIPERGGSHPITQITERICDIFGALGFDIVEGPEVETDRYNFEALNIPKNHPARDMQDTFYVSENIVLRTHTSPIQVRTMEQRRPPLRVIAPGKVYRCDSDLTHTPMFHQVEGLMVDEKVSFGDLKGILTRFVHQMFDPRTGVRFRPSFFPFTEPSAEVDICCVMCRGRGCRVCSGSGWLEVLGSGLVHPAVFENVGYDPAAFTGFALGMGVERIAMLKFGIDDIRKFFESDLRFLRQFPS